MCRQIYIIYANHSLVTHIRNLRYGHKQGRKNKCKLEKTTLYERVRIKGKNIILESFTELLACIFACFLKKIHIFFNVSL